MASGAKPQGRIPGVSDQTTAEDRPLRIPSGTLWTVLQMRPQKLDISVPLFTSFLTLGTKPRAFYFVVIHSATEQHPQPLRD